MEKTLLKNTLRELYSDFYEDQIPEMTRRLTTIPEVPRSATVVLGMRRTGKTFLLYQRMNELLASDVSKDRMLHVNFEDDRLLGMTVEDLRYVPDVYYQMFPENRSRLCYFFLDEIQNIEHWEVFVRRMVDTPHVQVYLSGSSAKLLSREVATAMRGRSVEIENFPLSFEEFLIHHNYFKTIPRNISSASRSKFQNAVEKFFAIGGMPAVQDVSPVVRAAILQGYVNTVIYKDVIERHEVANTQALKFTIQMVFNNPARQLSVRKIADYLKSQQVSASRETISDYLDWLADAYLLHKVSLCSDSAMKRRTNPDKYYLNDIGIVRAMRIKHALDQGPLLENLVYLQLRRQGFKVEYVITSDGSEVDFIAFHPMRNDYKLLQVCFDMSDRKTFDREVTALRDAADALGVKDRCVVTWDDEDSLPGNVQVVPIWKFLLDRAAD
ncbi:MAG: ATP-binding protein [Lentisphaeria bacterium]|nr:ATP-binding protein [Lentisphaeria bacterium]